MGDIAGMTDRQWVLDSVREMPEGATAPEILEELALQATLRRRLVEGGQTVPHEQVAGMIDAWITKSTGRTKPSTT
jgi:predicted transcriptional regulator